MPLKEILSSKMNEIFKWKLLDDSGKKLNSICKGQLILVYFKKNAKFGYQQTII